MKLILDLETTNALIKVYMEIPYLRRNSVFSLLLAHADKLEEQRLIYLNEWEDTLCLK